MREAEAVAIVMLFFTVGFVFTVYLISRYARRKLEHREIMKAIEHGQPLPMRKPAAKRRSYGNDLRTGVLLINFAIGFGLFIWLIHGQEATAVALVPLFIGAGYLINSTLTKRLKLDNGNGEPVDDVPVPAAPQPEIEIQAPSGEDEPTP